MDFIDGPVMNYIYSSHINDAVWDILTFILPVSKLVTGGIIMLSSFI